MFYFNDIPCNSTRQPICEEFSDTEYEYATLPKHTNLHNKHVSDTSVECPIPYVPVGDTCLAILFYTATMNWPEALLACEAMAGHLAKINDPELLRAVYLYLHEHDISDGSFWIGGSDRDGEGAWVWLDGSSVLRGSPMWGFRDGLEQPFVNESTNCLGILSGGYHYFRDDDCEETTKYKPICEPQW
ncbi:unnamed protein product [Meganyctiphanes norvegica]|uniref:C-type lectin domain-containing protein n=1 Tax=Meganyctiphanes norvegica TaxID=48144 RepID=A0AAV2PRW2_MEGNR